MKKNPANSSVACTYIDPNPRQINIFVLEKEKSFTYLELIYLELALSDPYDEIKSIHFGVEKRQSQLCCWSSFLRSLWLRLRERWHLCDCRALSS